MNPPITAGLTAPAALIDLGAIEHNIRTLREFAGSAQVMAVVKADGYGHGAVDVARAALRAGAAELGVDDQTPAPLPEQAWAQRRSLGRSSPGWHALERSEGRGQRAEWP